MNEWWYLSTPKMTVTVEVVNGKVASGPPIVRKFVGQPASALKAWLGKQGNVTVRKVAVEESQIGPRVEPPAR